MKPNELLTQVSDKWQEFFKLLHESIQQVVEPEEDIDPKSVLEDALKRATVLNEEFETLLTEIERSL